MTAKLFIEVDNEKGTIAESKTIIAPRIGEVIDISEAKKSNGFTEVKVTNVSYKVSNDGLEVWLKAKPNN
jgi:hypothetical protein